MRSVGHPNIPTNRYCPSPWWMAVAFAAVVLVIGMTAAFLGIAFGNPKTPAGLVPGVRLPPIFPPDWFFWAVWIFLYPTVGVAIWYVWRLRQETQARQALVIFLIHLLANLSWVPIVSQSTNPIVMSVIMDLTVDCFVIAGVWMFAKVSRSALLWLLPYISWNIFTTIIKIWRLTLNTH